MSTTVLLSGGMDSVAALHWARHQCTLPIDAISFDYGQANREAELSAANRIASRLGVRLTTYDIGDAVRGLIQLSAAAPGVDDNGVSRANLPARNAIFLTIAARHAAAKTLSQMIELVIGCNRDDARAFPDCRGSFLSAMEETLEAALDGIVSHVRITAPWRRLSKREIVAQADAACLRDLQDSVSCYAGTNCSTCDACTLRAEAFR